MIRTFIHAIIRKCAYVIVALLATFLVSHCSNAHADQPSIKTYSNGAHNGLTSAEAAGSDFASTYSDSYATYVLTSIGSVTSYNFRMYFTVTINSNGQSYNSDQYGSITTTCPAGETAAIVDQYNQITTCTGGIPPVTCTANKSLSGTYLIPSRSDLTQGNATVADAKKLTCTDGCETKLNAAGADWYIQTSGANKYIEGQLKQTGNQCTAGTTPSQASTTPQTEKDCQAQGKGYVTANGVTSCVANGTAGANNPVKLGDQSTTNGNGTTNTETNTTVNNDNSVTTTTTTTNSSGTTTQTQTEDKPSFCEKNPNNQICKPEDKEPSGDTPGNPAGYERQQNRFYTTKYPNGAQGVWDDFNSSIDQSSAMSAMHALTPNIGNGGTAPTWTFNFNLGPNMNFGSYNLSPDSNIWLVIKIIMIVTALFAARSIIFGG